MEQRIEYFFGVTVTAGKEIHIILEKNHIDGTPEYKLHTLPTYAKKM